MAKSGLLDLSTLVDNVVSGDINDYSVTIYGKGGAGKSTFANALKRRLGDSASFFFEPRARGLGGIKAVECLKWENFPAYVGQLKTYAKKGIKVPFNNIVIDSVDSAYELCTNYIMEENEWTTLTGDYGARYSTVGNAFKENIRMLRQLGYIVTFATHETDEEAHDVHGTAFTRKVPVVSNQVKGMVLDQVDFIVYLDLINVTDDDGNLKEVRRLYFKNNPYAMLKVPLFGFPDYIEYEEVEDGVNKFLKAFDNAVMVTRAMYDNGEDTSSPNKDNELDVEFVAPVTQPVVDVEEVKAKAIEVRDKMLETMEKESVVAALKSALGTASIAKCDDVEKLNKFISENE